MASPDPLFKLIQASMGAYYDDNEDLRCMGCGMKNECCECTTEETYVDHEKFMDILMDLELMGDN